jgi:hypothetical protein
MTQAQQPEALRLTDNLEGNRCHRAAAMLRTQHARIAELEAAPAAQAVEPAAGSMQSGTVTYTDGATATGPGNLPQVSPRQQRAAALIDSVEALLGGANGPTIQLRALLSAPAPAAPEPVGEAGTMPGTAGFTMACFHADKVPLGTKLYMQPLAPTQAQDVQRDADMFWDSDDGERCEHDIESLIEGYSDGAILKIERAKSLPSITIRVIQNAEGADYEIIDRAAIAASAAQGEA